MALTESLVLVLVILTFTRLRAAVGTDVAAATDNAHALQSFEHRLHLNVELTANRWLAGHEALVTPAVILYRTYYAVLIGALLWVFFRHLDVYRQVRRTLVAMAGLAHLVYWVAPVSPPRFAEAGMVDLVAEHDLLGSHAFREANNLSAMPSLHVGWSALAAYAVWCAVRARHPRGALLAWAFPLVMVADVVATGNHYVLDVFGSAVLLLVSIALAAVWRHLVKAPGRTSTAGNPSTRWI